MKPALVGALTILVVAAAPKGLLAQGHVLHRISPAAAELRASADLGPASIARSAGEQPRLMAGAVAVRSSRRQGEILMIVGGAGIVTGLLVDESLITIAGAVVGGYGLYFYLRATR